MEPIFSCPSVEEYLSSETGQRIICCRCYNFAPGLGQTNLGQDHIKDFVMAMAFPSANLPLSSESPRTAIPRASYVLEVQRRVTIDGRDYYDARYFVPSAEEKGKYIEVHVMDAFRNTLEVGVVAEEKGDREYLNLKCPHHQPEGSQGMTLTRTVSVLQNIGEGVDFPGSARTTTGEWFERRVKYAPISIVWR